jgi:hypothetical protein
LKTIDQQIDQQTRKIEEWLVHAEPLAQQGIAEMAQTTVALPDIRDYFPAIPAIPAAPQAATPIHTTSCQNPNPNYQQTQPSIDTSTDGMPLPCP